MANVPEDLRYSKTHEWVRTENSTARIGITDFAQRQLGDVVYVDLPKAGAPFEAGDPFGTVESVKAATEIYLPVAGTVTAVNEGLEDSPEDINTDPYGDGWLIEITTTGPAHPTGLLDAAAYRALCAEESDG
ncbi:glycine cleavage system protein GcvH [Streptomyces tropicalis]|uniref:Glycine cleavage system H protein n=1 Tax=Streptomyces tropicalis TaxID=3034234 RepID=A0ABT6AE39_9ACTN|nr:glycine cleavage system protein GcvH [Streptomyces tropicalis]MDF3302923.1 glycine cleavage system protein GcvH [Streptomyces tropicalis]